MRLNYKVGVFILGFITATFLFALYESLLRYEQKIQSVPLDLRPWVDFKPYTATFEGGLFIALGAVLLIFWFISFVGLPKKKKTCLALLFLVATTPILVQIPTVSSGYYEDVVDVLAVVDEEFAAYWPDGWERYYGWEIYINMAFDRFYNVFGKMVRLRGWIYWDSTDGVGDLGVLLQEAIAETGFQSGKTVYVATMSLWGTSWQIGFVIDVLLVFTGEFTDMQGFSYPYWNALIINGVYGDNYRKWVVQHEMSHQFYASHCNEFCVMNQNLPFGSPVPDSWCDYHKAVISANINRFDRWVEGSFGVGGGGGRKK